MNQGNKDTNKDNNRNRKDEQNQDNQFGSTLTNEEREQRIYDDYKAHSHEHNRDLKAEFREGELHGVVGKEIHDVLKNEHQQRVDESQHNKNQRNDQQRNLDKDNRQNKNQ